MPDFSFDPAVLELPNGPLLIAIAGAEESEIHLSAHRHRRGQLLASMRGLLSVNVESKVWVVPPIHAVWLPPAKLHSVRTHGPAHGWGVFIQPSGCVDLPQSPCTIRVSGLLREAVLRAATLPIGSKDERSTNLEGVILDEIRTLPVETLGLPLPADDRLARIAEEYLKNPADERDLENWARWAAVGARTLSRRFVSETGFTFTAWRQRARLLRSLEMLASGLSVTNVAADLGYSTTSAFIGLFRRTFGETPSLYRSRLRNFSPQLGDMKGR
jgi:AraC-like DNA-binding protein